MNAPVDVLAVLRRHLAIAKEVASDAQVSEAREVLATVDELIEALRIIESRSRTFISKDGIEISKIASAALARVGAA